MRSYLSTKEKPATDTDTDKNVDVKTSSTDADEPSKDRYNGCLSKQTTLKKALTSEVNEITKDLGVARDELVNAIKEKSVFRAVKAVGMGGGKVALDGLKTVDTAVNFAADKVAPHKWYKDYKKVQ